MKGDRAAEDELNPSRKADLCWSGGGGRGGAGRGEAGKAGEGRGWGEQGHCVCGRGPWTPQACHGDPALKLGDSRVRPTLSAHRTSLGGWQRVTLCLDPVKA